MGEDLTEKYRNLLSIVNAVAQKRGILPAELIAETNAERERIAALRKSSQGQYRVLGIDKFSGEDWVEGEYMTAEEALLHAQRLTRKEMGAASESSVATVYYAYDPQGNYLGGDTWEDGLK